VSFDRLGVSREVADVLEIIYQKAKVISPALTRQLFLDGIIKEWLEPYLKKKPSALPKNKVVLRNNLKHAITLCGKTQAEVARVTGVNRSYLGQIIRGDYDPSVTLALVILQALNYPMEKFTDVFFLEPADQD